MEVLRTKEPKRVAASVLSKSLQVHNGGPVLLLLSGGSWFEALDMVEITALSGRVTVGMCDDRFSTDSTINNFAQLTKTNFYKRALELGVNFIDTRVQESESLASLAQRFEKTLRDWKEENTTGVIIATLGMGADGHTAGLFADFEKFVKNPTSLVVGYEVQAIINQFTKRISVTSQFLTTAVTEAVVMVSGQDKCHTLSTVLGSGSRQVETPATIWYDMNSVVVVTDCGL